MNNSSPLPRSPLLMSPQDTGLLIVDVQEKLVPLIHDHEALLKSIRRLVIAAELFDVRLLATEQYPLGLGPTVASLGLPLTNIPPKTRFSCAEVGQLFGELPQQGIRKLLVAGIETHVCIQQTALDLLAAGFEVYVAVDAVGSRGVLDHEIGIRRMESSGVYLTTVEAALFEWCGDARASQFRQLSQLIKNG